MADEKRVYTVSTAHLDTVWRWDLDETIREYLPATISDNFYLFQTVPGYTFNFEGAYRYHLIEEYYPDFFKQIQDYVRHGQWYISGSAYENGDVNIPSPEALFRNILLGNLYFEKKFGKRSRDLFLPDCFGFGAALPAVIRHSNLLGFTTQKLAWGSAYGRPFDLGVWQGVDGSQAYACLDGRSYRYQFRHVRTDTSVTEKLAENEKKAGLPWALHLHGNGDKGGSPEKGSALAVSKALKTNNGNTIQVYSAASDQIFKDLDDIPQEAKNKLPVCDYELVMTDHGVGGYTSRCMSKRLNRKNEILADMAERCACVAEHLTGYPYPRQRLNDAWKRVITHQFHDDITGTSNMAVYNRSWGDYFKSLMEFRDEMTGAVGAVAGALDTSFVQGCPVVVYNSVAAPRTDSVSAKVRMKENSPYIKVFDETGREVKSQVVKKQGKSFEIVFTASLPAMGFRVYDVRPSGTKCQLASALKVTEHSLENEKYFLRFNKNGDIGSIMDKELGRELLIKPIKFALLKDTGALNYPAWELRYDDVMAEPYAYANTPSFRVVMNGPSKIAVEVTRTAGGSTFTQIVSLTEGGRFIAVENQVDWQSRRTLLKLQFPFTAASQEAVYDLGLGVLKRSTNTRQLYEVPAQKWADLSDTDADFGVSIFSDSKYGWDKPDEHTLRLTCVHTPAGAFTKETRQDLQDVGCNRFGFAIFSHSGDYTMGTQLQSEFYSYAPLAFQISGCPSGNAGSSYSFVRCNDRGVIIRAVKKAEESDEMIVRVNEAVGMRHREVSLSFGDGIQSAREVYASEEPMSDATVEADELLFDIEPFQVKTFALTLKKSSLFSNVQKESQPLKLPYNADVITKNANRQLTVMAASGTSLPDELFPEAITVCGIPFHLGKNHKPYNALIPREQSIPLPKGYNKLAILAASVRGDKEITLLAGHKPRAITVHDFMEPVGQWEQYALEQTANVKTEAVPALEFTHTHAPDDDNYAAPAEFFLYEIDVSNAAELELPYENSVVILAMTAIKKEHAVKLATPVVDAAPEYAERPEPELTEKLMDKMDFVTIRAGKIQDQVKGGKGKGLRRNNPITNIIRSYTKSEW